MKEAAENNLQKNRLSIGSLFFYLTIFLAFTAVSVKSENTASILIYKSLVL
jgi:hypothetical protein